MPKPPTSPSEPFSRVLFFTKHSREEVENRKDLREHYFFKLLREAVPMVETRLPQEWASQGSCEPSALRWVNAETFIPSPGAFSSPAFFVLDYSPRNEQGLSVLQRASLLWRWVTRKSLTSQARSILVSRERDAARISRKKTRAPVTLIPPLIDAEEFTPRLDGSSPPTLLVVTEGQSPHDAQRSLNWFFHEIEPRLKRPLKNIRVIPCDRPGSSEPHFGSNTVACFPHRKPSFKNYALLQAMACSQAIVTTAHGAASLTLSPTHEALVSDDANVFSSSLFKALSDQELRLKLGQNSRKAVEARHHWLLARPLIKHLLLSLKHSSNRTRI